MMKKLKIELIYFTIILIILAIIQHPDLLSSPVERIELMSQKENYIHPILWTSVIYLVIGIIRVFVKYLIYLKRKIKAD